MEGSTPGGQLIVSHEVENYPGFSEAISGMEFMELFKKQADHFGAGFLTGDETISMVSGSYRRTDKRSRRRARSA